MHNQFIYEEITAKALDYLRQQSQYRPDTLRGFQLKWLHVRKYMRSLDLNSITPAICRAFLIDFFNDRSPQDFSRSDRNLKRSVLILTEFMERGTLKKEETVFTLDGGIGSVMKDFLAFKRSQRLIKLTMQRIECHLSRFNLWLTTRKVLEINDIKQKHVIGFIKSLDPQKKALVHDTLLNLRAFFKYTYANGNLATNLAQ
jgi:hypothetical protein